MPELTSKMTISFQYGDDCYENPICQVKSPICEQNYYMFIVDNHVRYLPYCPGAPGCIFNNPARAKIVDEIFDGSRTNVSNEILAEVLQDAKAGMHAYEMIRLARERVSTLLDVRLLNCVGEFLRGRKRCAVVLEEDRLGVLEVPQDKYFQINWETAERLACSVAQVFPVHIHQVLPYVRDGMTLEKLNAHLRAAPALILEVHGLRDVAMPPAIEFVESEQHDFVYCDIEFRITRKVRDNLSKYKPKFLAVIKDLLIGKFEPKYNIPSNFLKVDSAIVTKDSRLVYKLSLKETSL